MVCTMEKSSDFKYKPSVGHQRHRQSQTPLVYDLATPHAHVSKKHIFFSYGEWEGGVGQVLEMKYEWFRK